jgi:hypothetical protein
VTALETTEVVVTNVAAIARCTPVATITEFKPELYNSPFTKRQLFPFNESIGCSSSSTDQDLPPQHHPHQIPLEQI